MLFIAVFTNCEKNEDSLTIEDINYVGFESDRILGVDPAGTLSQELIIATSTTSSSDRTFNIEIDTDLTTADASAYSVPSSITVPANSNVGVFVVDVFGEEVNPSGEDILALGFIEEEGLKISEPISLNLKQVCSASTPNALAIEIVFDDYPEEMYWVLEDANGIVDESAAGVFGAYAGMTGGITQTYCLADGTYTFTVYDQYSDGMCCDWGEGSYLLSGDGNIYASGGEFGFYESTTFTLAN